MNLKDIDTPKNKFSENMDKAVLKWPKITVSL
jgi:hypothetical protein